ncbi:hypothetical protein GKE82_09895 [Conexibacter sp. W3-3-2]|uniref:hypothetical protein n=1 Tax=Conexibacter sp. W3-3-2 TaxID=2675227 RepID=UPI0012B75530|nr:hypothetical protein [Conexibacter sp. W3-3-2]MTD44592.1 hypothetical protein [Conexibacter sp. W3-3-2]
MSFHTTSLATVVQAAAEPAGGAAIGEVLLASAMAGVATAVLGWLGYTHRTGRSQVLARAGAVAERTSGMPAWAALPGALAGVALLVAVLGMYWDIALHIDDGRDAGPLANPAHYFILAGLFGIFAAGFLAIVLSPQGSRPSRGAVRVTRGWYAPLGGVLMICCSAFSLVGFPLDDVWHRLFGQDVTLWGPTHLMLIGGAGMTLVGMSVLLVEGGGARALEREETATREGGAGTPGSRTWAFFMRMRFLGIAGGFLVGLSTFQAEFDFGVPQFALILQPALITVAAGVALVSARVFLGPGAALWAVFYFVLVRGGLALIVGPGLGETTPHFPLYLGSALVVEGVALLVAVRRDPVRFGAIAGAAVGTVGLLTEQVWTHVWMTLPWPADMLPETLAVGLVTGIAAGALGGWVGAMLRAPQAIAKGEDTPRVAPASAPMIRRIALPGVCGLVVAAVVGYGLMTSTPQGLSADVRLADVAGSGQQREATAEVTIRPASKADDARWLTVTAWQGGTKLHVDRLEQVGPGRYRSTEPLPLHGDWKTLIRLHTRGELATVPIYLPEDRAIPAPAVPAPASFTRAFQGEKEFLQREAKGGVSGWLWGVGYAVVLGIAAALLVALAWGLARLAAPPAGPQGPRRPAADRRSPAGLRPVGTS